MTPSILVLEDDENLQILLVESLEDEGYTAQGVSNAEDAIKAASAFEFDLVISDVRMAGQRDGLAALEVLKKKRPELRCLVITGYADDSAPVRAIRIQVDDYLYKPFNLEDLSLSVKKVLASGQERTSYRQLFSKLWSAPRKLLEARARTVALEALEQARDQFWRGFFVAVRSKLLSKGAFLDLWDRLEKGESQYESLLGAAEEPAPAALQRLAEGFRLLSTQLTRLTETRSSGSHRSRSPELTPVAAIFTLYERVVEGKVTAEQLRVGATVSRLAPNQRDGDLSALYTLLFVKASG